MNRYWTLASIFAFSTMGIGCSETPQSNTEQPAASVASDASAVPAATSEPATLAVTLPVDANSSPHDVVLAFLNAMRDGNGRLTAALSTAKAQEETVKHNWPVQPPGAPTATYQLGAARYVDLGQTAVVVPCVWTETDDQNGQTRFEVEWRMHRQTEGWRVAGFSSEIVPGKEAYYFDFEDIAKLKDTQASIEAAMAEADSQATPDPLAQRPSSLR